MWCCPGLHLGPILPFLCLPGATRGAQELAGREEESQIPPTNEQERSGPGNHERELERSSA